MGVILKVMGYDKRTEFLEIELDVPEGKISSVMSAARVTPQQAREFGSIPLDMASVVKIGHQLDRPIYSDLYDWFLEPVAA